MKLNPTIIISVVLALILAASLTVFASLNHSGAAPDKNEGSIAETSDASAKIVKTFNTFDGEKLELMLKDTDSPEENGDVSYTDGAGSTYVFSSDGNLVEARIYNPEDNAFGAVKADPSLRIKETDAKNAAAAFGKNMLGEKFDRYTSVTCTEDDDSASYLFSFKEYLGENGFIGGPVCNVRVRYDGKIDSMHAESTALYDSVDISALNGITEKEVWDHADRVVADTCTTQTEFTSITHTSAYLGEVNGKFVIIAELKLCSKVDIANKLEGKIFVNTDDPYILRTETYNGPGALDVLVIYPID